MSKVKDPRTVDFIFIWKIENLSFIRKHWGSPIFVADTLKKTKWRLYLNHSDEKIHILTLVQCDRELPMNLFYELSVLGDGGLKQKSPSLRNIYTTSSNKSLHIPNDIFGKKEILPGDTLTVQCKMWEKNAQFLEYYGLDFTSLITEQLDYGLDFTSVITKQLDYGLDFTSLITEQNTPFLPLGFGFARTRIGTERKSFIWTIASFSSLQEDELKTINVELCSYRKFSLTLIFFICRDDITNVLDMIAVDVKGNNGEKDDFTIALGISVLNINDGTEHHLKKKSILLKGKKAFERPAYELKIADLLLSDDVLCLKCDLVVSKGVAVLNELERTTYGAAAEIDLAAALANTTESPFLGNEVHSSQNSLKNDLSHLFEDKIHADISIRVLNKTFPVHKAILSARSPVFKAMLDTDMEEKLTNHIEIDDMEPDTMRQFLSYLYSDTLDSDITWKSASGLYLAAEKYAVPGLKEKCSCFLKMNLNRKNVCEIVGLADILKDEGLKYYTQSFIQNAPYIIDTNEWKQLVEKHPRPAVEILTHLLKNRKR